MLILIEIFVLIACCAASKTKKLEANIDDTFHGSINALVNSKSLGYDLAINEKSLNDYALTCFNMFKPILGNLPNAFKSAYVEHISKYATNATCGDSAIFSDVISPLYGNITNSLRDILTDGSKQAKSGVACLNSSAQVLDIARSTSSNSDSRALYLGKISVSLELLKASRFNAVTVARLSLLGSSKSAVTFTQLKAIEKNPSEVEAAENNLLSAKAALIELNQNSDFTGDPFAKAGNSLLKSSNTAYRSDSGDYIDYTDNIQLNYEQMNKIISGTDNINKGFTNCLDKVHKASYLRLLNMVGSHIYIDKVFDKDVNSAVNYYLTNLNSQYTVNSDGSISSITADSINADPSKLANILSLVKPANSQYISAKKDKSLNQYVGKACYDYVNSFNNVKDSVLDNFLIQVNKLLAADDCNILSNTFNYNMQTDLVDQTMTDNFVSAFGLSNKKKIADQALTAEYGNYQVINQLIRTFNQTEKEMLTNWATCARSSKIFDMSVAADFVGRMGEADKNKNGLATLLGRCDVNYDKIQQSFASFYADFNVACKNKICKATCTNCGNWDGTGIVLSEGTELNVNCCNNYCGVVIKQTIVDPTTGVDKAFYGGEWFNLLLSEDSVPLTPTLKIKLSAALNSYVKERDIQNKILTADPNAKPKYYTNDVLVKKLNNILTKDGFSMTKSFALVANSFSLLSALNYKLGDLTVEEFANKYLMQTAKGGFLSCYKGKCLAECDSPGCQVYNITKNNDLSKLITPPDAVVTPYTRFNFDKNEVFVPGSSKYGKGQPGIRLSTTNYQAQCVTNKDKLGAWNQGYDLLRIKQAVKAKTGSVDETIFGTVTDELSQLSSKLKHKNTFAAAQDLNSNSFLYGDTSTWPQTQSLGSEYTYLPNFYVNSTEFSLIKDSISVKANMNLGKVATQYLRGSENTYNDVQNNELAAEFNPDDWKPRFTRKKSLSDLMTYYNLNNKNVEIDIQCNEYYCVMIIMDTLAGTDYVDFAMKSTPVYNIDGLRQDQKVCVAQSISSYVIPNPFFPSKSFGTVIDYFPGTLKSENPLKGNATSAGDNYIITGEDLSYDINSFSFISKKMSLLTQLKTYKTGAKKAKSAIQQSVDSQPGAIDSSGFYSQNVLTIDPTCDINNTPYPFFPVKQSCIRELNYSCSKEGNIFRSINRYVPTEAKCPSITSCQGLNSGDSEDKFELCGDSLSEIFLKSNLVTVDYSTLAIPCDTISLQSAYQVKQRRNAQTYVDPASFSKDDNVNYESNISNAQTKATTEDIKIDGSTQNSAGTSAPITKDTAWTYDYIPQSRGSYFSDSKVYLSSKILKVVSSVLILLAAVLFF